ncbi:MAG: hypothetical protein ACRCSO_11515 [Sphingomonas sp.]
MPFAKLFRSRWSALLWAGGMLWFAYDVASSAPVAPANNSADAATDATGAAVSNEAVSLLANFAGDGH